MMAIPLLAKAIGVGALGLAGWALFGGDDDAGGGNVPRPPYTAEVRRPGGALLPWSTVDDALCLSFDAVGAADALALQRDLWGRLFPSVPQPPVPGDHPSVGQAYELLVGRVSSFVNAVQSGEPVCVDEPPPPPPPPTDGPIDWDELFADAPNHFVAVRDNDNLTRIVQRVYGIAANETLRTRQAIGCVATVGYNLLFVGRRQPGNDYGRGQTDGAWYDVNWAMLPRNADPRIVAALRAGGDENARMRRWIGWESGAAVSGNPGRFFPLWMPPTLQVANAVVCSPSGTWNPARNPPADVLAALGWTLEEMRDAWLASPLAGPEA
jgi:hypothetical protein